MIRFPCLKDPNHPFTQVPNAFIYDNRLCHRSKMLLIFLFSKHPSWCFNYSDILRSTSDGLHSVKSSIKELIKFGYMSLYKERNPNKTFHTFQYSIYETPLKTTSEPLVDFPLMDKPLVDKPLVEKPLVEMPLVVNNKIVYNTKKETTATSTKVINTNAAVSSVEYKKKKKDAILFLSSLGVVNQNYIIEKHGLNNILKYAVAYKSKIIIANSPVAFLVGMVKEKWDVPSIPITKPGLLVFQPFCSICGRMFSYLGYEDDRNICQKCEKKRRK